MKFASLLPSMFGNGGGGGNEEGGFNMADMMKMMSAMNGMGGGGPKRGTKAGINKQGLRNLAKRQELQKKLATKKK